MVARLATVNKATCLRKRAILYTVGLPFFYYICIDFFFESNKVKR